MKIKVTFAVILILSFHHIGKTQKFEPQAGKCLVFVGQDLEATGGLEMYHQGYTDYFETPAGITLYTNLSPGNGSYGHYNKGLDGIKTKANWAKRFERNGLFLSSTPLKTIRMLLRHSVTSIPTGHPSRCGIATLHFKKWTQGFKGMNTFPKDGKSEIYSCLTKFLGNTRKLGT